MSLFKKDKTKSYTIQDCEQNFSKLQFELGGLVFLIDQRTDELNRLNDRANEIQEEMKKWTQRGILVTNKAKHELEQTIKQGEKNEGSLN